MSALSTSRTARPVKTAHQVRLALSIAKVKMVKAKEVRVAET